MLIRKNGFIQYNDFSSSEYMTVYNDFHWISIIVYCIAGVNVLANQHDPASAGSKKTDIVVEVNGAIVLKCKQKASSRDLSIAEAELTSKLHPNAVKTFPMGSNRILGVASAINMIKLLYIVRNNDGSYDTEPIS